MGINPETKKPRVDTQCRTPYSHRYDKHQWDNFYGADASFGGYNKQSDFKREMSFKGY